MIEPVVIGLQGDPGAVRIGYSFDGEPHCLCSGGKPAVGNRTTLPSKAAKKLGGSAVIEIAHSCIWGLEDGLHPNWWRLH